MTTDAEAREQIRAAWPLAFPGSEPTIRELQFAQAVSRGESHYGDGWRAAQPAGAGSNNMGAVHAPGPPCDPATSFAGFDTDAQGRRYATCFRRYPTPEAGFAHFLRVLYVGGAPGSRFDRRPVRAAVRRGELSRAVLEMSAERSTYFELARGKYEKAVRANLAAITRALSEKSAFLRGAGAAIGALVALGLAAGAVALYARRRA